MVESTINPNRTTIRKINQDHVYLYIRTNAKEIVREGMDGETETLYQYNEEQIRMPSPDTGLEYPSATDHAFDQTELKVKVGKKIKYEDLVGKQEKVDRVDKITSVAAPISIVKPVEVIKK